MKTLHAETLYDIEVARGVGSLKILFQSALRFQSFQFKFEFHIGNNLRVVSV